MPRVKWRNWRRREVGLDDITGRSPETMPLVTRYGRDSADGIYLFIDSGRAEEVICKSQKLGLPPDALVFDEFNERVLEAKRAADALTFKTLEGPSVVQLGSATTVAKSLLTRIVESLRWQLVQRVGRLHPEARANVFCRRPRNWSSSRACSVSWVSPNCFNSSSFIVLVTVMPPTRVASSGPSSVFVSKNVGGPYVQPLCNRRPSRQSVW